jgi:HEAT repeat protein
MRISTEPFMNPLTRWVPEAYAGGAMVPVAGSIAAMLLITVALVVVAFLFRFRNRRKALRWARLEARWEPMLLDVIGGDVPAAALRQRVGRGEELYFVDFVYRYARRLRGGELAVLSSLVRPYLRPIVAGVRNGDPERRARAVQTLGVLDLAGQARTIARALEDPSPLVTMVAARALARPEQVSYAPLVLASLHRFDNWSPRFLSSMLASMGSDAAPILRTTLADRSLPIGQRTVAADALRKLADPDATDVAVDVLREPVNRDLHCAALRLIAEVGQPDCSPALRPLTTSADPVVRAQAIGALGRLGDAGDADSMRLAVDDDSPWVVIQALRGLRDVGRDDVVEELSLSVHARAAVARQVLAEAV